MPNDDSSDARGSGDEKDEAISELLTQELDTTPDFVGKVRRDIQRRTAVSQVVSYSWHLPRSILIEMVSVLRHIFAAFNGKKES